MGVFAHALKLVTTFHLVLIAWVFFRAEGIDKAFATLWKMAFDHGPLFWDTVIVQGVLVTGCLLILDIFNRRTDYWENLSHFPIGFRLSYVLFLLFSVVLLGTDLGTQFIYFQF